MSILKRIVGFLAEIKHLLLRTISLSYVECFYGNIWRYRETLLRKKQISKTKEYIYQYYLEHFGSWIGLGAQINTPPILPHGLFGIFISNSAVIGKNVVIFHQVTIGSNMLKDSKRHGAPTIGDNVYIGCGAKIIGNVHVGSNSRIGANCVVVKDVPNNSVTIMRGTESIVKETPLDNEYIANKYEGICEN